jgi:hypothetical protein
MLSNAKPYGKGECTVHKVTEVYVMFLGLYKKTNKINLGFFCEKCWEEHGDDVAVTVKEFTFEEFKKHFTFESENQN